MNGMIHHRIVDQRDANPLVALELDWPGFGEFLSVEPPHEALHVAREMQNDLAGWRTRIAATLERAQIAIGEKTPSGNTAAAGIAKPLLGHHRDVIDADFALERGGRRTVHPIHAGHGILAHLHA